MALKVRIVVNFWRKERDGTQAKISGVADMVLLLDLGVRSRIFTL